jgi:hypothetical protein
MLPHAWHTSRWISAFFICNLLVRGLSLAPAKTVFRRQLDIVQVLAHNPSGGAMLAAAFRRLEHIGSALDLPRGRFAKADLLRVNAGRVPVVVAGALRARRHTFVRYGLAVGVRVPGIDGLFSRGFVRRLVAVLARGAKAGVRGHVVTTASGPAEGHEVAGLVHELVVVFLALEELARGLRVQDIFGRLGFGGANAEACRWHWVVQAAKMNGAFTGWLA